MKKILLVCTFLYQTHAFAQLDTNNIKQTFRLLVAIDQNQGIINLQKLIKDTINIRGISSKGFKNVIFLSFYTNGLPPKHSIQSTVTDNKKPFDCNYIICYEILNNRIYQLKGFRRNDFRDFYLYEIDNFDKRKAASFARLSDINDFKTKYRVAEVDLVCLYEATILKQKNKGCLISCSDRDKAFAINR